MTTEKILHEFGDIFGDSKSLFRSFFEELTKMCIMEKKKKLNVLFWVRKGRTNENFSPLYCRVTISGQRYEISTNCHIKTSSWSAEAQRSIGKTSNDREINRTIEDIQEKIDATIESITLKRYDLNIENFKLMYQAKDNEYSTLKTIFEYHMVIEGKNLSESTKKQYGVTLNHLLKYVNIKYHISDYEISAIDKSFVKEFFAYLQGYKRKDDKKRCNINGALKHMERFNKVMSIAYQNDWINKNPVAHLRIRKEHVEIGALDEESIQAIANVTLKPNLGIVRDLFMFAVYTGISYKDLTMLTNENITMGIDRTLWLAYHRAKTGTRVSLPLLDPAIDIINRYESYHGHNIKNKIFPPSNNQVVNRYLKIIAKEAGVNQLVTFHIARHSFATTITLQKGIPLETVSKMLGHTSIKTTQIYAKVLDKKVMEDMEDLKKIYTKTTENKKTLIK